MYFMFTLEPALATSPPGPSPLSLASCPGMLKLRQAHLRAASLFFYHLDGKLSHLVLLRPACRLFSRPTPERAAYAASTALGDPSVRSPLCFANLLQIGTACWKCRHHLILACPNLRSLRWAAASRRMGSSQGLTGLLKNHGAKLIEPGAVSRGVLWHFHSACLSRHISTRLVERSRTTVPHLQIHGLRLTLLVQVCGEGDLHAAARRLQTVRDS